MRLLFAVFLLAAATLWPRDASAQSNDLSECNSCSHAQVKAKAKNYYAKTSTRTETLFLLDYHAPYVWECTVYVESEQWAPNIAVCGGASAQAQGLFLDIVEMLVTLQQADISIDYPTGDIYDIAGCPSCAANWIADNQAEIAWDLRGLEGLGPKGVSLSLTLGVPGIQVSSSYEGQAIVRVELSNDISGGPHEAFCLAQFVGGTLTVDTDTCVDSDGNPIPTKQPTNSAVRYTFTSQLNYTGMMNTLNRLGFNVETIPTGTVTVNPLIVDCVGSNCAPDDDDDEDEESQT